MGGQDLAIEMKQEAGSYGEPDHNNALSYDDNREGNEEYDSHSVTSYERTIDSEPATYNHNDDADDGHDNQQEEGYYDDADVKASETMGGQDLAIEMKQEAGSYGEPDHNHALSYDDNREGNEEYDSHSPTSYERPEPDHNHALSYDDNREGNEEYDSHPPTSNEGPEPDHNHALSYDDNREGNEEYDSHSPTSYERTMDSEPGTYNHNVDVDEGYDNQHEEGYYDDEHENEKEEDYYDDRDHDGRYEEPGRQDDDSGDGDRPSQHDSYQENDGGDRNAHGEDDYNESPQYDDDHYDDDVDPDVSRRTDQDYYDEASGNHAETAAYEEDDLYEDHYEDGHSDGADEPHVAHLAAESQHADGLTYSSHTNLVADADRFMPGSSEEPPQHREADEDYFSETSGYESA